MSRPSKLNQRRRKIAKLLLCAPLGALVVSACGGGGGGGSSGSTSPAPPPPSGPPVNGPPWSGYASDPQHSALGAVATQSLARIRWSTQVDLAPQYSSGALLIHYGSPVISAHNTVIVPVKTGAAGGFRVDAHDGFNGVLLWSMTSAYVLPPHNWVPSFSGCLTAANRFYAPQSGGRLLFRDNVDNGSGASGTVVFYGAAAYALAPATYDSVVRINTPLTADAAGNVYFGFIVSGVNGAALTSGIARVAPDGTGTWVAANAAAGDTAIGQVAMNCAPALSPDGSTLYIAVNTPPVSGVRQAGYLLALNSTTLATVAKVLLMDPLDPSNTPAWVSDDSTASPTIGPDGDVYYGVLEGSGVTHNLRGWLLHFDAALAVSKAPGAFGWDDTVSIVPRALLPSYAGPSSYFIATKYNNYAGIGTGDGTNRVAILDPNQTQADPVTGTVPVMKELLTKLGPTPDAGEVASFPAAVMEWCINTAAVDPLTSSILVNSEDGKLYRWHLPSNQFTESILLTSGYAEAYTPTLIGPDGAVYAINTAVLFCIGT